MNKERSYILCAAGQKEMEAWVAVINKTIPQEHDESPEAKQMTAGASLTLNVETGRAKISSNRGHSQETNSSSDAHRALQMFSMVPRYADDYYDSPITEVPRSARSPSLSRTRMSTVSSDHAQSAVVCSPRYKKLKKRKSSKDTTAAGAEHDQGTTETYPSGEDDDDDEDWEMLQKISNELATSVPAPQVPHVPPRPPQSRSNSGQAPVRQYTAAPQINHQTQGSGGMQLQGNGQTTEVRATDSMLSAAEQVAARQLRAMKLSAVKRHAVALGVGPRALEDAYDMDEIKEAVISLILEHGGAPRSQVTAASAHAAHVPDPAQTMVTPAEPTAAEPAQPRPHELTSAELALQLIAGASAEAPAIS